MDDPAAPPARTRGLLLLGVVFLLGLVSGAALLHLGQRSIRSSRFGGFGLHGRHDRMALERLADELKLDPDQRKRVEEMLNERRARVQKFLEESRSEIRNLLRPEQQGIFDTLHFHRPGRHEEAPGTPAQPPGSQAPAVVPIP